MDVNIINPFIGATIKVLSTMATTEARAGDPYLKKDNKALGDITGIIGLSGDARGTIAVSFASPCILGIVSNMFGETISDVNDEVQDAVGEITNMISGQARQQLELMNKSMQAAIPTVVTGKEHQISYLENRPIMAIPFKTDHGEFTIEVCIE